MPATTVELRWAPRVQRQLIRRLYEREAQGILDEDLVNEVAFAFYVRCRSVIRATAAARGQAFCPGCEGTIAHSVRGAEVLRCSSCSWEMEWREYRKTFHGKYLITGNPEGAFTEYPRRLEAARTPRERMLAIDWMVHQVHSWTLERERPIGRPTAVNLIEGNESKVVAFLDELAVGFAASDAQKADYAAWRKTLYLPSERERST
jgi:hypothetical protein